MRLILEDGTAYAHEGVLQLAEASVDQGTGSVTLRAVFPNPERDLLPGMYVRARIEEGVLAATLLIPQQAVVRDAQGQPMAMIVDAEEKVAPRPLELDRAVGGDWIVRQGLAAGDRVIVEGLQKARPGVQVRIAQDAM
ncbi:MAG: efflux RND transporter periplasmic adaptor subunit [Desulfomicrobium sp.]|nr:efflux RND transporter periplasmic adaptor subunit [Pseudomonadota bacterium]MBV1712546.1 efflux RND transporter periplasmic adaptor subunit [Desulfomicrobium sp.]MBU4571258.1 efflux RND transporter periplasmic adaptor subunit [Pseudomonadota bacterium]MBU4592995.1 efflux RND transporter periplasmic adaptor subunit [Pseudomonadota bacterium]MBV1720617.1 efflux RND transporter periplasmic adaptor subunit [Desulfomicrobium sp.]